MILAAPSRLLLPLLLVLSLLTLPLRAAAAGDAAAPTVVHMLDYVGVDYPNFVKDGQVLNSSEYEEQKEFAGQVEALLSREAASPEQAALVEKAKALIAQIEAKADGAAVAGAAASLKGEVIKAFNLTVAPSRAPSHAVGAKLFADNCAACHGDTGLGDGRLAAGLEPKPSNFHDDERMRQRSLYGLFNTIALGVEGTPMRAFSELSDDDRWALAFFVGSVGKPADQIARGEALWKQGVGKSEFANLKELVTPTPQEQAAKSADLAAVQTYLAAHPDVLVAAAPSPLSLTRGKLAESLAAYQKGDKEGARQLAITAYLEGFELIESALDNVDKPLREETETHMMALRSAIADGKPEADVASQVQQINALLDKADEKLSGEGLSPTTAFLSSLLILVREGLEAILVLAAIISFVAKTGRRDALPYIHAGWLAAMGLGVVTWAIARYAIAISGANREMTEGVTAMIAVVMLLYVGYWLHNKSNAKAWQVFIKTHVSSALEKRTLWAMAGISFLAVYRELFEVILFYETLWEQAGPAAHQAVLFGIVAAIVALFLIGGAILKFSVRLPIGPFFSATSGLLAFMAVVFAGNGIKALQEAGVVDSTAVHFVSVPLLGLYPTLQGLSTQFVVLALIVGGIVIGKIRNGGDEPVAPSKA